MHSLKLLSASLAFLCVQVAAAAPTPSPVNIFVLAGQPDMEGQGVGDLDGKDYNDGKGTLRYLAQDPVDEFGNRETYFVVGDARGKAKKPLLTAAGLGFSPIFDGKTLDGWKAADMSYWSVEDGAITGKITPEHPLKENLYLIWQGGELADFELKLKSRVFGSKDINNGFQFRSKEMPNHDVAGYQVDNNLNTDWLVRLYDEHGRHTLAWRGQRTVFDESGEAHNTDIQEAKGTPWFKLEGWHEYHLICQGTRLTLKVDGRLAADVVDNDPKQQDFAGILGLQLHTGPPTTAQFKDIRLKVLKPASAVVPAVKTASAKAVPQPTEADQALALTDKTLVVWAAPDNLTQRGGSALTLEDGSDHFDGVVFGEIMPGKWMAGSDLFSRTQQVQSNSAAETADSKTLIQLAIVYRGKQVTLYRNGAGYAQYEIPASPQEFGPQSMVVFGKRHRHQTDNAHFSGAIDDARIYDRALSAEQIAALKPNEVSSVVPWAWWSFDNPGARERTGRFPITQISGAAKVEDGKLVLDGKTGTILCKTGKEVPFVCETPARPGNPPSNWLTYHLAHPGPGTAMPGDPNCAFYWKGRYHLHYIYTHKDGFSFAHVSSTDLLHWRWHPTTLTPPKTEHGMFSGTGFFTKEGRPAVIYHGQGSGRNQIAIAEDDQLEKWSAPIALEPKILPGQDESKIAHWDPDAWVDGENYYALSGGSPGSGKPPTLFKSPDLKNWDYLGLFLTKDMPDVQPDEDISCPNFFKIGNKHMLLCISHNKGCRYYLGEWNDEKFTPEFHARMNWKGWDFFAPESVLTPGGRRVMWAWCNVGEPQSGIQSLPRELSLPKDGILRIKPLRELEKLRFDRKKEANLVVKSEGRYRLREIAGETIELKTSIEPGTATEFGVEVYCDQDGKGGFPISIHPASKTLSLGSVQAPFELRDGEKLELRVFLDKTMIEVFANDRQAMVASHRYAPGNMGVSIFSKGGAMLVKEVIGWKMKSIYANR